MGKNKTPKDFDAMTYEEKINFIKQDVQDDLGPGAHLEAAIDMDGRVHFSVWWEDDEEDEDDDGDEDEVFTPSKPPLAILMAEAEAERKARRYSESDLDAILSDMLDDFKKKLTESASSADTTSQLVRRLRYECIISMLDTIADASRQTQELMIAEAKKLCCPSVYWSEAEEELIKRYIPCKRKKLDVIEISHTR